jgi:hypothetical protein
MPLLFGDLKTNLAKFAGDGAGDDAGRARSINQAIERLMTSSEMALVDDSASMH